MNLNLTTASRLGLNLLALLGVAAALYLGESIFVPLTIAVLLSSILWPMVEWMHRRGIPWGMASMMSVIMFVIGFLIITFGFTLAIPRVIEGVPRPNDDEAQKQFYKDFRSQIALVSPVSIEHALPENPENSGLFQQIQKTLKGEYLTNLLLKLITDYLKNWVLEFTLIMFIMLFLLMEGRMLSRRLVEIFGPSPEATLKAQEALRQIALSVRSYLIWRTIVNFGLGIVLGIIYHIVGLKHAWLWALFAAILCYVPYIGTIIAGIPPVLDAFLSQGPLMAVGILVFYIALVTFEGYIIVPVVMGRRVNLNATTVILSCLFWSLVWGTPGLFLAMPLMAAVKAICEQVPGWRPWANLMSNDEKISPDPDLPPLQGVDPGKTMIMANTDAEKTLLLEDPAPRNGDDKNLHR
jgi:predicted PurR-regulated permease PerM